MSYVGEELRGLRKAVVRLNQRLAQTNLEGEVIERDPKTWRVRLKIGEDPASGEAIKSPWLKPASQSNQSGFKVSPALPSVGSRMRMVSPSGVVGAASYAEPAAFDDEQKRPDQEADESVIQFGKTRMSFRDDKFLISTGEGEGAATIAFDGSKIAVGVGGKGYEITADEMRMTHKWRAKGGSRPAVFKGSKDSGGDTNNEGNEDVLV
jgi:phage baseplate assembly protein gpV